MGTNNQKEKAIIALRSFKPTGKNDVIKIIETILSCYVKVEVEVNEQKVIKVSKPINQSKEVTFLIEELQSFIDAIKNKKMSHI